LPIGLYDYIYHGLSYLCCAIFYALWSLEKEKKNIDKKVKEKKRIKKD